MAENKEIIRGQNEQVLRQPTEKVDVVMRDLQKEREVIVPREVKNWMQKVEEETSLSDHQNQNTNDDSILQPIAKTPKITLPTNRQTFSDGFNKTVGDAGRWLSEFVFRLIKKNKGNVKFKKE